MKILLLDLTIGTDWYALAGIIKFQVCSHKADMHKLISNKDTCKNKTKKSHAYICSISILTLCYMKKKKIYENKHF